MDREKRARAASVDDVKQSRYTASRPVIALDELAAQRADVAHGRPGGVVGDEAVAEDQRVGASRMRCCSRGVNFDGPSSRRMPSTSR